MNNSIPPSVSPVKKSGCLKALLLTTLTLAILIIGGAYYVSQHLDAWLRGGSGLVIEKMIEGFIAETHLSPEDSTRIRAMSKKLVDRIANGEISLEQGLGIFQKIVNGPLLGVALAKGIESALPLSGLPAPEVAEGLKVSRRFAYGLLSHAIEPSVAGEVLKLVSKKNAEDQDEISSSLSAVEVQAALQRMKQAVEQAHVPENVPTLQVTDELERAIEQGIAAPGVIR